jgi:tRNA pseudouridine13 synthase
MTLRRTPQDFRVFEVPSPHYLSAVVDAPSKEARHAVYELRKTSLSTPEALGFLCRDLRAKASSIDYAGLKDKHAETVQLISVCAAGQKHAEELPAHVQLDRCEVRRIGWSSTAVSAESITGNRFELVVRDLRHSDVRAMRERAAKLSIRDRFLVPNYFGDQRFGSIRHGGGFAACALIKGDFDTALRLLIGTPARKDVGKTRDFTRLCASHWGDWRKLAAELPRTPERRAIESLARGTDAKEAFTQLPYFLQTMCVEAFQSHLWNKTALHLIRELGATGATIFETQGLYDVNLFPEASRIPDTWLSLNIPVLAHNSEIAPPWDRAANHALHDENLTVKQLKIPGLRRPYFGEAIRPLIVSIPDFTLSEHVKDELAKESGRVKVLSTFTLPRGAYATVVMRALGR